MDGLRLLAAAAVFVHHVEQMKSAARLPSRWLSPTVQSLGPQGVLLFFTLSGFLIAWLLLGERAKTGTVSVGRFLARRALRILPLYFLVVLLAFAVMPSLLGEPGRWNRGMLEYYRALEGSAWQTTLALFLLMLPNLAYLFYPPVPFAAQCWSIGVEEQFYLAWPWMVRGLSLRRLTIACAGVWVLYASLRLAPGELLVQGCALPAPWGALARYAASLPLEYFAAGALAAIWRHARAADVGRPPIPRGLAWSAVPAILALLSGAVSLGPFNAVGYAASILGVVAAPRAWLDLERPTLRYLGGVSYGIYMFQGAAIFLAIRLTTVCLDRAAQRTLFDASIYLTSIGLTLAAAAASHRYFEGPFLRLRSLFSGTRATRPAELDSLAGEMSEPIGKCGFLGDRTLPSGAISPSPEAPRTSLARSKSRASSTSKRPS